MVWSLASGRLKKYMIFLLHMNHIIIHFSFEFRAVLKNVVWLPENT